MSTEKNQHQKSSADIERKRLENYLKDAEKYYNQLSYSIKDDIVHPNCQNSEMLILFRSFFVHQTAANFGINLTRDMIISVTEKNFKSDIDFCGDFLNYFAYLEHHFVKELRGIRTALGHIGMKRILTKEIKAAELLMNSDEITRNQIVNVAGRLQILDGTKKDLPDVVCDQRNAFVLILKSIMRNLVDNFEKLNEMDVKYRDEVLMLCDPIVRNCFERSNLDNMNRLKKFCSTPTSGVKHRFRSVFWYLKVGYSQATKKSESDYNSQIEKINDHQNEERVRFVCFPSEFDFALMFDFSFLGLMLRVVLHLKNQ